MVIKEGKLVFDGQPVPIEQVEGWLVISPGNAQEYLEWAASREEEDE